MGATEVSEPMPVSQVNTDPGEILPTRDRMPISAYVAGVLLGVTLSLGTVLVGLVS